MPLGSTFRSVVHAVFTEDDVDTFRLWDWAFPGLFVPLRGRPWARYIPNLLTYSRLVLSVPVVLWLAVLESSAPAVGPAVAAFAALVLLRLTDILDGRAARDLGVVSDRGSKLDPLADGLLGFGLAVAAVVALPGRVPAAVAAVFGAYTVLRFVLDGAVMAARIQESGRGIVPLPTKWGKLKYNLDYAMLLLIHAGILACAAAPAFLVGALVLATAFAPLNVWFGAKNLHAHRARMRPDPAFAGAVR